MNDHSKDGSGYAYCHREHPTSDQDAREWCRRYHWVDVPNIPKESE